MDAIDEYGLAASQCALSIRDVYNVELALAKEASAYRKVLKLIFEGEG